MSKNDKLYKIIFTQANQSYEIYAKNVYQSDLFGFIQIENFVFRESTDLVIDISEEKLATEFEGVKSSYIPMHSVIRIDEVSHCGKTKISDLKYIPPQVMPIKSK